MVLIIATISDMSTFPSLLTSPFNVVSSVVLEKYIFVRSVRGKELVPLSLTTVNELSSTDIVKLLALNAVVLPSEHSKVRYGYTSSAITTVIHTIPTKVRISFFIIVFSDKFIMQNYLFLCDFLI